MSMYSVYYDITPYTTRFPALDNRRKSRHGIPDLRVRGRERKLYVRNVQKREKKIALHVIRRETIIVDYYIRHAYVCSGTSLRYVY